MVVMEGSRPIETYSQMMMVMPCFNMMLKIGTEEWVVWKCVCQNYWEKWVGSASRCIVFMLHCIWWMCDSLHEGNMRNMANTATFTNIKLRLCRYCHQSTLPSLMGKHYRFKQGHLMNQWGMILLQKGATPKLWVEHKRYHLAKVSI